MSQFKLPIRMDTLLIRINELRFARGGSGELMRQNNTIDGFDTTAQETPLYGSRLRSLKPSIVQSNLYDPREST